MNSKLALHYIHSSLLLSAYYIKFDFHTGVLGINEFMQHNKPLLLDIYVECDHSLGYKLTSNDFIDAIKFFIVDVSVLINQTKPLEWQPDGIIKPTQEQSEEFDKLCESILKEYNV